MYFKEYRKIQCNNVLKPLVDSRGPESPPRRPIYFYTNY